jgi:virulence factor Mce-like protein
MAGAVAFTGMVLTGNIAQATTRAFAEFENCGQGLREGGDIKLRGVLVGRIGGIDRTLEGCSVRLNLFPSDVDQIPANVGAQIRAKTVFGEKWVELIYPSDPAGDNIAKGDVIPADRTIDPLEVETILNVALPLLDAIDPEKLSGALVALSEGFVGHEDAAVRGIKEGIRALEPLNDNKALVKKGLDQLAESGRILEEVDNDFLAALDNLDLVNQFTSSNAALIDSNLEKAPVLFQELTTLFTQRFADLTKIVDRGATVISVLASRKGDLDRLLTVLPKFNSAWIRNLNYTCRYRQQTDEPGKSVGDRVPGRCWRVHNVIAHSRGPYGNNAPKPDKNKSSDYRALGITDLTDVTRVLFAPAASRSGKGATR